MNNLFSPQPYRSVDELNSVGAESPALSEPSIAGIEPEANSAAFQGHPYAALLGNMVQEGLDTKRQLLNKYTKNLGTIYGQDFAQTEGKAPMASTIEGLRLASHKQAQDDELTKRFNSIFSMGSESRKRAEDLMRASLKASSLGHSSLT